MRVALFCWFCLLMEFDETCIVMYFAITFVAFSYIGFSSAMILSCDVFVSGANEARQLRKVVRTPLKYICKDCAFAVKT